MSLLRTPAPLPPPISQRYIPRPPTHHRQPGRQVRLVRKRDTREIYALKSMVKNAMVLKNQVGHLRDERDLLAAVGDKWIVGLFFSFQDEHNLYMVRSPRRHPSRPPWAGPSRRSGPSLARSSLAAPTPSSPRPPLDLP